MQNKVQGSVSTFEVKLLLTFWVVASLVFHFFHSDSIKIWGNMNQESSCPAHLFRHPTLFMTSFISDATIEMKKIHSLRSFVQEFQHKSLEGIIINFKFLSPCFVTALYAHTRNLNFWLGKWKTRKDGNE